MSREAKRLFIDLDVGEVSLVDEPANEIPIAVMKQKAQETEAMGDEANVNKDAAGESPVANPIELVPTSVEKTLNPEAVAILKTLGEALTAKTPEVPATAAESAEVEKALDMGKLKKALADAGMDETAMTKVLSMFKPKADVKKSDEPDVKKSLDADDATADMLEVLSTAIMKAKKFTPKRAAALKDAVTKLTGLLGELSDEDADKASFGASGIPAPGTSSMSMPSLQDQSSSGGGTGSPANTITKSASQEPNLVDVIAGAVSKALEPLATQVASLKTDVDTIQKARMPPTAAETEVEKGKVKDVQKSAGFWNGVI